MIFSFNSFTQSYWNIHTSINLIGDVGIYQNQAYICHRGGLSIYNLENDEEKHLNSGNSGLHGAGTYEIDMNNDGTYWLSAYRDGLHYFDGTDFVHYYNGVDGHTFKATTELNGNGNKLFFESNIDGNAYSQNGIPYFFDGEQFHDLRETQLGDCTHTAIDQQGNIFGLYQGHIFEFDNLEGSLSINAPNIFAEIKNYTIDSNNNHWIVTNNYLRIYDGSSWTTINNPGEVTQIINREEDTYVIFKDSYAKISDDFELEITNVDFTQLPKYTAENLNSISIKNIDKEGAPLIYHFTGYEDPQLYRYFDSEFIPYAQNKEDKHKLSLIFSLSSDCEGNIYSSGSSSPIYKFDGQSWLKLNSSLDGIPSVQLKVYSNPYTCEVWAANSSGVMGEIFKIQNDFLESYPIPQGMVRGMSFTPEGGMYIAYNSNGLLYIDEQGNETLYNETNSSIKRGSSCHYAKDGTLWFSGEKTNNEDFVGSLKDGVWTIYDSTNSLIDEYAYKFFEDSRGTIWLPNQIGFLKFNNGSWQQYAIDANPLFAQHSAYDMIEDLSGNYWISTTYDGLFYWDGFDFIKYNVENSDINANSLRNLELDRDGNLWVQSTYGLSQLITNDRQYNNFVKGKVFFDENQDGIKQDEEIWMPGQKVFLNPQAETSITNSLGVFAFYDLQEDTEYELTVNLEGSWVFTTDEKVNFNIDTNSQITDIVFGIYKDVIPRNMEFDMTISAIICSEEFKVWFTMKNPNYVDVSGDLSFEYEEIFTEVNHFPEPDHIQEQTVEWYDMTIPPLQFVTNTSVLQSPSIQEVVPDSILVDTLNLDQQFHFSSTFTSISILTEKDSSMFLCSFDPNDKLVESTGPTQDDYFLLKDTLVYTIRFQNLGNYRAKNVVVIDTLDAQLDWESFELVSYSHQVEVNIDDQGIVTFRFADINLPPEEQDAAGSNGFVKFKIAPLENLNSDSQIENQAHIYFDYNPAIITNEATKIAVDEFPVSSIFDPPNYNRITIYPNPSDGIIYIEPNSKESYITEVFNSKGQLISRKTNCTDTQELHLTSGLYFVKLHFIKSNNISAGKIIVN